MRKRRKSTKSDLSGLFTIIAYLFVVIFHLFKFLFDKLKPATPSESMDKKATLSTSIDADPGTIQIINTSIATDDDDNYDPSLYWFPVEPSQYRVDARLSLQYLNTRGITSDRDVDVFAFQRGIKDSIGHCMFSCFCHMRNARRTLSSKCVVKAIDRDTGNSIINVLEFLEYRYNLNPDKPYDVLFQAYGWLLYVLMYIASVDGAVRAPERKIIANFCLKLDESGKIEDGKMDTIIKDLMRPSRSDFHRFIRNSAPTQELAADIVAAIRAIISTNKQKHTEQIRALNYIEKRWKEHLISKP
jgi:hypothetical protein